jgi:hypothetical protein
MLRRCRACGGHHEHMIQDVRQPATQKHPPSCASTANVTNCVLESPMGLIAGLENGVARLEPDPYTQLKIKIQVSFVRHHVAHLFANLFMASIGRR